VKSINRLSLSEQVAQLVLQYISEHELKPGDQIPTESEFAELFQVSRSSIREAMKALSINGLLVSTPGKGTFLQPKALNVAVGSDGTLQMQAKATITEIMEVRTPLEIKAIELAAIRGSGEEIDELEEITKHYREAVEQGSGWPAWGSKFHAQIAAMSGNPLLISTLRHLSEMVEQYRNNLALFYGDKDCYIESHKKICAALRHRDVDAAREEMCRHMKITEEALQGIVDAGNAEKFLPCK